MENEHFYHGIVCYASVDFYTQWYRAPFLMLYNNKETGQEKWLRGVVMRKGGGLRDENRP